MRGGCLKKMVTADRKCIAVSSEYEHVQIRAGKRHAAGKWQRSAMDEMHSVRLHEIRKPAGTADARNRRDLLVMKLALFDQLEIQGQYREVTTARAPCGML